MDKFEKSSAIKSGIRKGFRDGSSKMARRRCYGYNTAPDGRLVIDPTEVGTVRWIFQKYLEGNSLGKIAADLESQGTPLPYRQAQMESRGNRQVALQRKVHWPCTAPEDD